LGVSSRNGTKNFGKANGGERCIVVHPHLGGRDNISRTPDARLEEATGLARAIELEVLHAEVIRINRPRPGTLFGPGAVSRLGEIIADSHPDDGDGTNERENGSSRIVAVVDATVTAVQQRNLERAWQCKVVDRTGLILEIFAARARSREGRLQVELAALNYQRSRLVRTWTHLERQRGGFGFLGGPGETQIESDRRQIGERIQRIERELSRVSRTRALHRRARRRVPYPMVALVGYTNAGKSTLFNTLTQTQVAAKEMLFATLDPTMRSLRLSSARKIILSDTVGFISDLPHELVAAFRATLEEVCEADLIVHVRDAAHPDLEAQRADVERVLADLGFDTASDGIVIEALNKIDVLTPEQRIEIANRAKRSNEPAVLVSALTGEGCNALLAVLDERLSAGYTLMDVCLGVDDGATLAWLYDRGEVVERREDDAVIHLKVRLAPTDAARFARRTEAEA
jgi:GTP-binding protein HflX